MTDDLALTPLPRILRDFRQLYPRIDLELTVAQSTNLLRRVESGHLDLAFVKHSAGGGYEPNGRLVRRDPLVWAGIAGTRIAPDGPVPLVAYQAPSLSRSLGVQTLEQAGRSCRITCIVRGVNGVLAAVRAGLGIAIFAPVADARRPGRAAAERRTAGAAVDRPGADHQPAGREGAGRGATAAILGSNAPLKPDAA